MKNVKQRALVFLAFSLFLSTAFAILPSTGPIELGVWNASFYAGYTYARENHIPMLLFWANPGCGNCANLNGAVSTDPDFLAWQEQRKIVMVFDEGGSDAKSFARNSSGKYPYMSVYWLREDGTEEKHNFSGLTASFPVTRDENGTLLSYAMQLAASTDYYIKDYVATDFKGGRFKVGVKPGNSLEAVPGVTSSVTIPLVRELANADYEADIKFEIVYPDKQIVETNISWRVGERTKDIAIQIPSEKAFKIGDAIALKLVDEKGAVRSESLIRMVDNAKSGLTPVDPLWLGEPFEFGRFTMDYEAAKSAVAEKNAAGGKAYTLAFFTGSLWCPYCKGIEDSLLADQKFYAWAASNNVALVEFDQGRASKPASAAGTRAPRLLTYEPDPTLSEEETMSGAGYISRHSVNPDDAEAVIAQTTRYTAQWLSPESTAKRTSQPSFLLIKDDRVVARFAAQRDDEKVYDVEENLRRLDDLLLLADRDSESNDYRTTTVRSHVVGNRDTAVFQISDRSEYFNVEGIAAGKLVIALADESEKALDDVAFTLYQGGSVLTRGTNGLEAVISADTAAAGGMTLGLTTYAVTTDRLFASAARASELRTTQFTTTFSSKIVLIPEDRNSTVKVADGAVVMQVVKGQEYRLAGFDQESLKTVFDVRDAELGIYVAKESGEFEIQIDSSAAEIGYQAWNPGVVGFTKRALEVTEGTTDTVSICVTRNGGASGRVVLRVDLDSASSDLEQDRYVWTDQEVVWEDGESGEKTLPLTLLDDVVYDAETQRAVFQATVVSGVEVGVEKEQTILTVKEDDRLIVGSLAISDANPGFSAKMSVVAQEESMIEIGVSRQNGAMTAVSAEMKTSAGTWQGSTQLNWADRDRVVRRPVRLQLPSLAECPSGVVVVEIVPHGITVDSQRKALTIYLYSRVAPSFVSDSLVADLVRNVSYEARVGLTNIVSTADVEIKKLSGRLPAGLEIDWSAQLGQMAVAGVPTMAGCYEATYRISQTLNGEKQAGGILTVRLTVADPVEEKINPSIAECRTFRVMPMIARTAKRLAGVMTVTIPTSGRVSAKYQCRAGMMSLVATGWESCEADGTLIAKLTDRAYSCVATVRAHPDGRVDVLVEDSAYPGEEVSAYVADCDQWGSSDAAANWRGQYTVACIRTAPPTGRREVAASGHPIFSLRMTSASAVANGRMTYAGYLPDGRSVSGSAVLAADPATGIALLPIFLQTEYDTFAAPIAIEAGAADACEKLDEENPDMKVLRAIQPREGWEAYWEHRNPVTEYGDFAATYSVYGSFYDPGLNLASALMATEVLPSVKVLVDVASLPASQDVGKFAEPKATSVTASGTSLSATGPIPVSLAGSTGLVSGTFDLPAESGTIRTAYRGVVLPGWTGCGCLESEIDLPFVLGSCWFADNMYYQEDWQSCSESDAPYIKVPVKRGCAIEFATVPNPAN